MINVFLYVIRDFESCDMEKMMIIVNYFRGQIVIIANL